MQAHPRVCGENRRTARLILELIGSSPRVRGKLVDGGARVVMRGLIPACAGKTWSMRLWGAGCLAHPRVCGENFVAVDACGLGEGSSPRVRGKHTP